MHMFTTERALREIPPMGYRPQRLLARLEEMSGGCGIGVRKRLRRVVRVRDW